MPNTKQSGRPASSSKPTVLIVEDVVLVRMLLANLLRERGFEVIEASTADEAVRVLEADFPVGVVLTDIYMPGSSMDGLALARWVHAHRPGLKVILGSGVVSVTDPADAAFYEAPILQKPYKREELELRLRAALDDPPQP
ncbi:MAG TPA: response regulator [Reyranella sp.]|nr:response regulator [Reyranella sp.]